MSSITDKLIRDTERQMVGSVFTQRRDHLVAKAAIDDLADEFEQWVPEHPGITIYTAARKFLIEKGYNFRCDELGIARGKAWAEQDTDAAVAYLAAKAACAEWNTRT